MKLIVILSVLIVGVYIAAYCCIYTAVILTSLMNALGFDAEIRVKDMVGTRFRHAYTHVFGLDLFLNPFREYSDEYKTYTVREYVSIVPNWGQLYNPITDTFI